MVSQFVEVAFPIPLNKTFNYKAFDGSIGCRVLAPFGPKKTLIGYCGRPDFGKTLLSHERDPALDRFMSHLSMEH